MLKINLLKPKCFGPHTERWVAFVSYTNKWVRLLWEPYIMPATLKSLSKSPLLEMLERQQKQPLNKIASGEEYFRIPPKE